MHSISNDMKRCLLYMYTVTLLILVSVLGLYVDKPQHYFTPVSGTDYDGIKIYLNDVDKQALHIYYSDEFMKQYLPQLKDIKYHDIACKIVVGDKVTEYTVDLTRVGNSSFFNYRPSFKLHAIDDGLLKTTLLKESGVTSFDKLILRASGDDAAKSYIRNATALDLLHLTDIEYEQYSIPCECYINGLYYGLYYLTTPSNDYYYNTKFNTDVYTVTRYTTVVTNDALLKLFGNIDFSDHDAFRKRFNELFDVHQFLRYYALILYLRDTDSVKVTHDLCLLYNKDIDKYYFVPYDLDQSFNMETASNYDVIFTLNKHIDFDGYYIPCVILEVPEYREYFIHYLTELTHTLDTDTLKYYVQLNEQQALPILQNMTKYNVPTEINKSASDIVKDSWRNLDLYCEQQPDNIQKLIKGLESR